MITSIVVTGEYNIGINSSKKICINDNMLSAEKDIPFIRYRLASYGESTLAYIDKMMKQFPASTHLVEFSMSANTTMEYQLVTGRFSNVAKFLYIDITEEEYQAKTLTPEKMTLIQSLAGVTFDRYMFRDKTTSLDTIALGAIKKNVGKILGIRDDMMGVCSSPLSFGDSACLTAVKARELMSLYSTVADVALPSANHQCMNCCGCIRYLTVNADTVAPADAKPFGGKKAKAEKAEGTEGTAEKKPAKPKAPGKKPIISGAFGL